MPSLFLAWLIITSIVPTNYLSNIPIAKALAIGVDTTTDAIDAAACETVVSANLPGVDGVISLREAICVSNNTVGTDAITFSDALGPIVLTSNLPTISDTVTITGGNDIIINGTNGAITTVMTINANSCTITGLEIYGAGGTVLAVTGNSNNLGGNGVGEQNYIYNNSAVTTLINVSGSSNTFYNNYIGITKADAAAGASQYGIYVNGASNIIGGSLSDQGNFIADNELANIYLDSGATGTEIKNTRIGTNSAGNAALGTNKYGIRIENASNIVIGPENGTESGNIISGHMASGDASGIIINGGTNTQIYGNYIGTDATGMSAIANVYGINFNTGTITATVGGNQSYQKNIISGNSGIGISDSGSGNAPTVTIKGNYIGIAADGLTDLGNTSTGILVGSSSVSTTIGGTAAGDGNIISGNNDRGIEIRGNATLQGNKIGTNAAGTGAIANSKGILFQNFNATATVGSASAPNIISGNTTNGIEITGGVAVAPSITISGNYIGTDVGGTLDLGNGQSGIRMDATNVTSTITIGDSTSAAITNVISGNNQMGIYAGTKCSIYSSQIGTNVSGGAAVANDSYGINVQNVGFTIGANSLTTGFNVISGNTGTGIYVTGSSATGTISGNIVGLDVNGSAKIANTKAGIEIYQGSTSITIGDSTSATATNVISGNTKQGIAINDTDSVQVYSSIIGANKTQTSATNIGNTTTGIKVTSSDSLIIGNTRTAGWNVIANNGEQGILIQSGNNSTIQGNFISTDQTVTHDLGNGGVGIAIGIGITGTTIGGTNTGEGNIITHSDSYGITVATTPHELIRGNLIYSNGTPSDPIQIDDPGVWNLSGLTFTTATTSKVEGTISGITNGTAVDIYSGTDGTNPAMMTYEGSTTLTGGNFSLEKDFTAVAGNYFYVIAVDTSSPKTTEASTPSAAITQDSTAPTDPTVTSSTSATSDANYSFVGGKESNASIENDGTVWVAKGDSASVWTYPVVLTEGTNTFNLCSEDYSGNRSGTGIYTITLDTIAPAVPTLEYTTPVSGATTIIHITGEAGARIFVNNVNSGENIGLGGTKNVTVSLTANATNTFIVELRDSADNPSLTTTATIIGGDPIVYGGGGGGNKNKKENVVTTETQTVDDTTVITDTTTDANIPAGEEEITEENYDEQIESPDNTAESTADNMTDNTSGETPATNNTANQSSNEPAYQNPTVTTEIYDNTALITYQEPINDKTGDKPPKVSIIEVTINKDKKTPKSSIIGTLSGTQQPAVKQDEFITAVEEIAEAAEIQTDTAGLFEQIFEDDDGDNISDIWEEYYVGDVDMNSENDTDGDGMTNAEEFTYALDPTNGDSDFDGLGDMIEIYGLGTDPNSWDSDGDGVSDVKETFEETSPTEFTVNENVDISIHGEYDDSDSDGISDYVEAQNSTDPYAEDTDGDGLTDSEEILYDTNPNSVNQISSDNIETQLSNVAYGKTMKSTKTVLTGTSTPNSNVLVTIIDLDNQPVLVLEGTTDGNGIFAVYADKKLVNGSYKIFVVGLDEKENAKTVSAVTEFNVDDTADTGEVTPLKFNDSDIGEKVESQITRPKITGKTTKPGTKVNVTWRSFVFTSVLISDSITGEFTVEAPEELEGGDHTVYFYPVDPTTGVQGETMMVNFTVVGEGLSDESEIITTRQETENRTPYLPIVVLTLLVIAGGYLAYKKSSRIRKAEKKLIDKL